MGNRRGKEYVIRRDSIYVLKMNRARDRLEQAKEDLRHAEKSLKMKDYAWACFACQQGAEKAVKALYVRFNMMAWERSVTELLASLPSKLKLDERVIEKAKMLDKYYIPTRYPNAHPQGHACKYYTEKEAKEVIKICKENIEYCEHKGFQNK